MTTDGTVLPLCACGCGEHVATPGAKWKRGHFHRGEGTRLTALPGTAEEAAEMLDEEIDLGEPPELPGPPPGWEPPPPWDGDGGEEFLPPDEPPAELKDAKPRAARKVTATVRKDINAKISLGLEISGRIWAARDPWCGGTFVTQRPPIADALTDIVCQSADLVEWFTGPAGGFMIWLNLLAALQPVAVTIYGHHIAHSVGAGQGQPQQQDMSRYAA